MNAWNRLQRVMRGLPPVEWEMSCAGITHPARWEAGEIRLHHPDIESENVVVAFGGRTPECVRLIEAWDDHHLLQDEFMPNYVLGAPGEVRLGKMNEGLWRRLPATPGAFMIGTGPNLRLSENVRVPLRVALEREDALVALPEPVRNRFAAWRLAGHFENASPVVKERVAEVCIRILEGPFALDEETRAELKVVQDLPSAWLGDHPWTERELLNLKRVGHLPKDPTRREIMMQFFVKEYTATRAYNREDIRQALRKYSDKPGPLRDALIRDGHFLKEGRRYRPVEGAE